MKIHWCQAQPLEAFHSSALGASPAMVWAIDVMPDAAKKGAKSWQLAAVMFCDGHNARLADSELKESMVPAMHSISEP